MIILMKNRRLDKFKKYYTAVCLNCGSKFAFSEDDMGGLYRNMWITCPVCDDTTPQYIRTSDGIEYSNFKEISRRRYNWIMKKYGTKNTNKGDEGV